MKLVQYDGKHEQTREELELGDLSVEEQKLVEKVLGWLWLDKVGIFTRYNCAVLCSKAKREYDEDGEPRVMFER